MEISININTNTGHASVITHNIKDKKRKAAEQGGVNNNDSQLPAYFYLVHWNPGPPTTSVFYAVPANTLSSNAIEVLRKLHGNCPSAGWRSDAPIMWKIWEEEILPKLKPEWSNRQYIVLLEHQTPKDPGVYFLPANAALFPRTWLGHHTKSRFPPIGTVMLEMFDLCNKD